MAVITFMSDFGWTDHYVAAVKAKVLCTNPGLRIVDLTHEIAAHSVPHASHVLKSVFRDFPKGTVHLVAVGDMSKRLLALKLEDHFFVGPDNGLFSLISDQHLGMVIELKTTQHSTFVTKDVLAPVAAKLASGSTLHDLGPAIQDPKELLNPSIKANKRQIGGHVIHVDHYGNLITNIPKHDFDVLSKERNFRIMVGRHQFTKVHKHFYDVESGECFLLFNSQNMLQVGINQGHSARLLGLDYYSPITILFEE